MSVAPFDRLEHRSTHGWLRGEKGACGIHRAPQLRKFAIGFGFVATILVAGFTAPAQAIGQRCAGGGLKVEILRLASKEYKRVEVRITNKAAVPCVLHGNPRILLTDGAVVLKLPEVYPSDKLPNHKPTSVLLRPNHSALVVLSQARCADRLTAPAKSLILLPGTGSVSVRSRRLETLGVCDGEANGSSLGIGDFSAS